MITQILQVIVFTPYKILRRSINEDMNLNFLAPT